MNLQIPFEQLGHYKSIALNTLPARWAGPWLGLSLIVIRRIKL